MRWQTVVGAAVMMLASSCSSSGGPITGGSGGLGGAQVQCAGGAGGAPGEPSPESIDVSGGVPVEQFRHAMAIARCSYWGRCSNLAPYVVNQCIDALTAGQPWTYQECAGTLGSGGCTTASTRYTQPTPELLRGVEYGTVHYDPDAAGRCIGVLQGQACIYPFLVEWLPACAAVFTCPSGSSAAGGAGGASEAPGGAGGGGGEGSVGRAGGGGGAWHFRLSLSLPPPTPPPHVCATDADCADVTVAPQGPYCVSGLCADSPCGLFDADCVSFAQVGEDCSFDAPGLAHGNNLVLSGTCAPGLACQGAIRAVRDGICVVPHDVGGACASTVGCLRGLACLCGVCELPPTAGPCADGLCRVGPAFCDFSSLTCGSTRTSGASCSDATNACTPGLVCDAQASSCVIPQN